MNESEAQERIAKLEAELAAARGAQSGTGVVTATTGGEEDATLRPVPGDESGETPEQERAAAQMKAQQEALDNQVDNAGAEVKAQAEARQAQQDEADKQARAQADKQAQAQQKAPQKQ